MVDTEGIAQKNRGKYIVTFFLWNSACTLKLCCILLAFFSYIQVGSIGWGSFFFFFSVLTEASFKVFCKPRCGIPSGSITWISSSPCFREAWRTLNRFARQGFAYKICICILASVSPLWLLVLLLQFSICFSRLLRLSVVFLSVLFFLTTPGQSIP